MSLMTLMGGPAYECVPAFYRKIKLKELQIAKCRKNVERHVSSVCSIRQNVMLPSSSHSVYEMEALAATMHGLPNTAVPASSDKLFGMDALTALCNLRLVWQPKRFGRFYCISMLLSSDLTFN